MKLLVTIILCKNEYVISAKTLLWLLRVHHRILQKDFLMDQVICAGSAAHAAAYPEPSSVY